MSETVGCGDNSCMFRVVRQAGGMATNGGCRCLTSLRYWNSHEGVWNDADVQRVHNGIYALKSELSKARRERDELRQRILDSCPSPDEGGRIHAGGRIVCGQCHDSEVRHLRAQLAEAVGVLGYLVRFVEAGGSPDADDLRKARAFLAKHPEGK